MNTEKIKEFVNEHKAKLIFASGAALAVAMCAIGIKKKNSTQKLVTVFPDLANNMDIPKDFAIGEITELWKEGEWLNAIVNEVTTKDIGRLGEEFVKCGIVPEGSKITMLIGFI